MSAETLRSVTEIIEADLDGFELLLGDPDARDEPRRREAMMTLLLAAYQKGYEAGFMSGARRMAEDVKRGLAGVR